MIKKAQNLWENVYTNRTNMLWSKEEYLSSMHTYQMLKKKAETISNKKAEEESKLDKQEEGDEVIKKIEAQDQILINLQDGCERAK